jgi:hypothetical protein
MEPLVLVLLVVTLAGPARADPGFARADERRLTFGDKQGVVVKLVDAKNYRPALPSAAGGALLPCPQCPAGYIGHAGTLQDVLGWGAINGRGGGEQLGSQAACAALCSNEVTCQSFEYSCSLRKCNLNTEHLPNGHAFKDYRMCSKAVSAVRQRQRSIAAANAIAARTLPASIRRCARRILKAIDSAFAKAKAQYILVGGTLLGQQRQVPPGPMPWDDDIDVQVVAPTPELMAKAKERVVLELSRESSPFRMWWHNDSDWEGLKCVLKNDEKNGVDIFFSTFVSFEDFGDSGRVPYLTRFKPMDPPSHWRKNVYSVSMHPAWVFPLSRCAFMDIETWCPARPIQILIQQFGESVVYNAYSGGLHGKSGTPAVTVDMRIFPELFKSGTTGRAGSVLLSAASAAGMSEK